MGFFESLFGSKPKAFDIKAYNFHLFFEFIPKKLHDWEEKKIAFDAVINFDSLVQNNKIWKSLIKDTKVISSGIKQNQDITLYLIDAPSNEQPAEVVKAIIAINKRLQKSDYYTMEYSFGKFAICSADESGNHYYMDECKDGNQFGAYVIKAALENSRFEMYYQPVYNVRKKLFSSAEALIRLNDPQYGFVSPALFIPAAEYSGAIHQIGDFVLEDVCRFISECDFSALKLDYIEINLSVAQAIEENLFEKVCAVINHFDLSPSQVNLEITETLFEKKLQGSLLGVLDKTNTAMGSRKMKQWLREPLKDVDLINGRLEGVQLFLDYPIQRNNIRECLKQVYDFERLAGRIATGKANGRDLIALKESCSVLPEIRYELQSLGGNLLSELHNMISPLEDVFEIIDRGIVDEPPYTVKEGGLIKPGFSRELDDLKASIADAQHWIASLEGSERERTGIKNLKVGFNKVFGYYLEVTKSYYDLIPEDYIRKQTLVNCERFITPELKETERLVLNAETEINRLEYDLFCEMRDQLRLRIGEIQKTSAAIAAVDVLAAFAQVSEKNDYRRPEIDGGDVISIEKGRHPVIETTIRDGIFVSNDTYLDRDGSSLMIITGPNMSGKSTYMRQTALIVLMAQAGCFVPARKAHIGICDRIFTRIGASDNLAQGQSTFFVEMSELSYILNTATSKSLVILDEIGRGTSTYDGLSIAWAAAEYLCSPDRRMRTLFATHYHEMTVLEETLKGARNLNVDVSEDDGNIVFLHKIVEGSASRSYGIHVAKLAGAPAELLENASIHLDELNSGNENNPGAMAGSNQKSGHEESRDTGVQLSIFDSLPNEAVCRLRDIDLMNTTPSEALRLLEEIKSMI